MKKHSLEFINCMLPKKVLLEYFLIFWVHLESLSKTVLIKSQLQVQDRQRSKPGPFWLG